jgi:hypothetical protein
VCPELDGFRQPPIACVEILPPRKRAGRGTPRGLFGSSGWMIDHSKSVSS